MKLIIVAEDSSKYMRKKINANNELWIKQANSKTNYRRMIWTNLFMYYFGNK